jgi:hypothetical protein
MLTSGESCPICWGSLGGFFRFWGEKERNLPCNHRFHKQCIEGWLGTQLQPTCPICRRSVEELPTNLIQTRPGPNGVAIIADRRFPSIESIIREKAVGLGLAVGLVAEGVSSLYMQEIEGLGVATAVMVASATVVASAVGGVVAARVLVTSAPLAAAGVGFTVEVGKVAAGSLEGKVKIVLVTYLAAAFAFAALLSGLEKVESRQRAGALL